MPANMTSDSIRPDTRPDNLIEITRTGNVVRFEASPIALRKIIFWTADVIWTGWYENDKGRKIYQDYVKDVADGVLMMTYSRFWEKAANRVLAHVRADGYLIY